MAVPAGSAWEQPEESCPVSVQELAEAFGEQEAPALIAPVYAQVVVRGQARQPAGLPGVPMEQAVVVSALPV